MYILVHALLPLWWDIPWCGTIVLACSSEEVKVVWLHSKTFDT